MDFAEIGREMAAMDALLAPIAHAPVNTSDPDWVADMLARFATSPPLDQIGARDRAEVVLRAIVDEYETGDDGTRVAIRHMFDRYPSFRWAAHLPPNWDTAAEFRVRLIHLSARDQGADARDEILFLQSLCAQARLARIDIAPVLDEVAAMSSEIDKQGMGSTKEIVLGYGQP